MNPYSWPPLVAAILNLVLVFWVYADAPAGAVRRSFLLWNIWLTLWNAGVVIGYSMPNADEALSWYSLLSSVVVRWIAPLFLHFVLAFTDDLDDPAKRWILGASYGSALVFCVLGLTTSTLMSRATSYFWGYYPIAGPQEWVFGLCYVAMLAYAFSRLGAALRRHSGQQRQQLRYVLIGAAVCFLSGFTNFLPLYGVSIYPIGNLFNSLYSLIIAYAIVEHNLLNLRVLLHRGTVYALLSGAMTAVYLTTVALLQKILGRVGVDENIVYYMAAVPITAVLAPTIKSRIEPWVNHMGLLRIPGAPVPTAALPMPASGSVDLALMGILATEIAHELSKPLTRIVNTGHQLMTDVRAQGHARLARIEEEAHRASDILDSFVSLSPLMELPRARVIFSDLMDDAVRILGVGDDATITIERRYEAVPPIEVNPGQMMQVLTNLLQNAWQAMPGGGRLALIVRQSSGVEMPYLHVIIEDEGDGVSADILPRIFEPFVTTKKAQGGRGVGLTLSRAMIERHGGTILIESPVQAGRGTRVFIRLPWTTKEGLYGH